MRRVLLGENLLIGAPMEAFRFLDALAVFNVSFLGCYLKLSSLKPNDAKKVMIRVILNNPMKS